MIKKRPYNADNTKRKGGTNFFRVLGLALRKEDRIIRLKEVRTPMMSYEAMQVMLTFGLLLIGLLGLVVAIIKVMINKKK